MTLKDRRCTACKPGMPPLAADRAAALAKEVPGWTVVDGKALRRDLVMKDFLAAVALIDRIAPVAEAEDHHPDLHLTGFRKLRIELSTHAIGGLSENDFILAAKIDALPSERKP